MKLLWQTPLGLTLLLAVAADAQPPSWPALQWPLSCSVGRDCFIQHYPDVSARTDPTHATDYRCGTRSLPGLTGTQVILKDWATALDNQPVYPLASGVVTQTETNLPDGVLQHNDHACGNRVVIDHGAWESTYCHLKQNSVRVRTGQTVQGRDVLAFVGQSGTVVEPQLAFTLTHNGQPFDPFLAASIATATPCNRQAGQGLWQAGVNYVEAATISSGFASRVVSLLEVKANSLIPQHELSTHSPYLVSWMRLQGVQKADTELYTLTHPSGRVVARRHSTLPGNSDDYLSYTFVKANPHKPFAEGDWVSHYELRRGGRIILQKNSKLQLP